MHAIAARTVKVLVVAMVNVPRAKTVDCALRIAVLVRVDVVAQMTRATMLESHIRGSTETTLDQYRYIALGKTAAMFSWCGRSAAFLGDSDTEKQESIECFGKFGQHFGVAFQMADDLLDLQI